MVLGLSVLLELMFTCKKYYLYLWTSVPLPIFSRLTKQNHFIVHGFGTHQRDVHCQCCDCEYDLCTVALKVSLQGEVSRIISQSSGSL